MGRGDGAPRALAGPECGMGRGDGAPRALAMAKGAAEEKFGFGLFTEGDPKLGWLLNMSPDEECGNQTFSCVNLCFLCQDGSGFKTRVKFAPYFYIGAKIGMELELESYIRRRFEGLISNTKIVEKEDLDLKNHLSGLRKRFIKISFNTVQDLMQVKSDLMPIVARNQAKLEAVEAYESVLYGLSTEKQNKSKVYDYNECIVDIREFDVPYHVRFAIDNDVRCGEWYVVTVDAARTKLEKRPDLLQRAEARVCAFDIEATKLPLKFPDASYDSVMMISYMVDSQGYLIINRECVSEDIDDIEYTPKPEFEGHFKVRNAASEKELLEWWFDHMREIKPNIFVTYNGDFFDWPFIEERAKHHGLSMRDKLGFSCDSAQGECLSKFACHLDCFAWVKRDSYLPQGSQGLKAVTKAKLGYDPLEVNPEDMVRFASEQPQKMAAYSVSDAVATYYLYMTYVNPFIFSLATIIPMSPDEVLRKGSGTLCEMLLMVQAFKGNIICPNKHKSEPERFYSGRLLDSETYIGGHVECLESGVFRSDLPTRFRLVPEAYQKLVDNLDRDLLYAIEKEGKMNAQEVTNYDELENLRDVPNREEQPVIYHLDVAAMYPNIILTNRLQPPSIVTDETCAACDFNRAEKTCLRPMQWVWRGESFMTKRSEYYHLKNQIESEMFTAGEGKPSQYFRDLSKDEQQSKLRDRLKKYCQKVYKRVLDKPTTEQRVAGVCMRENSFYVDTVRSFRDRRYEYKTLNKDMVVLYDSLQLAHKCILNSFYGYVMRKGARWYSMEMAGIVTYTGAKIIQNARILVEQIGKPLELDTDGIWCALPASFPENFVFRTNSPIRDKKLPISYPCVMLNVDVALNNTNHQYQTLADATERTYRTSSECSIEFEVDGPYKAMILPASKEEGVLIKKRYAVFNDDGTLAELKGFEVKRRGELKLIKVFQAEVFEKFLQGSTLEECYDAVAAVADRWLDMLENQGADVADSELLDYISESSTMSKSLADYGDKKSCATTTAKRLADFLGEAMVKDKGLSCRYIVARDPQGSPVSERAVPVAIFETEAEVMRAYLRKWCKVSADADFRSIVDWSYYRQRLASTIQKIITIPAAMQKVANPVPRVSHPDWLWKRVREKDDKYRQKSIFDAFKPITNADVDNEALVGDLEDICGGKETCSSKGLNAEVETAATANTEPLCTSDGDDYGAWLDKRKRKWKDVREKRKRLRQGPEPRHTDNRLNRSKKGNSVNTFFQNREASLTRSHWEVLQFEATEKPGNFIAWVVAGSSMYKVPVKVSRIFYLNTRAIVSEDYPGKRVSRVLPHGKACFNLIEVILDEEQYKQAKKDVVAHLSDPEVEGVYETRLPLVLQAILQLGCVCSVDVKAQKRSLNEGWSLEELHMKTTTECSYLADNVSFIYLYHSAFEPRGCYALYAPLAAKVLVIIVNPSVNKEVSTNWLERQFRDSLRTQESSVMEEFNMDTSDVNFEIEYLATYAEAGRRLQRTLHDYLDQFRRPAVAIVECPSMENIVAHVPAILEVPRVQVPWNSRHSDYKLLGWQPVAAKLAMQRCAASPSWLSERIALCRYAHVPLGNLDSDWILFTADAFYARVLKDNQHVLWISDDGLPDLGGVPQDEPSFTDVVQQPSLCYPGAYRSVTIELKINHLAVNALLKSTQVNELEGGALLGFELDATGSNLRQVGGSWDETNSCAPAFGLLKQMVLRPLTVLMLILTLCCSPLSKLHDPSLHRLLHKVMQKVYALLLAELRKLGATIVYGSFSRIIIGTGKHNVEAAKNYCDHLLKTLQTREMFEWIELEPQRYWHSILFMDQYNYGAIQAKVSSEDNSEEFEIVSSWNIAEYLPKAIQEFFIVVVSEFIYLPWKHAQETIAARSFSFSSTPSVTVAAAADADALETSFLKEQIESYFTDKLLRIVRDIQRHFTASRDVDDFKFPNLAGSHLALGDAALEFIKYIYAAMSLDHRVQHSVQVMRKNLLRLVHVREFAPEAQFHDPCLSFTLPNVICSYCNDCRDLDLCRDAALLQKDWHCTVPQCGQMYNVQWIENALLQIVRQRERLYHLQDLKCVKCRQIKAAHITEQCSCGGSFECVEKSAEFMSKSHVFLNIATYYGFDLLKEIRTRDPWFCEGFSSMEGVVQAETTAPSPAPAPAPVPFPKLQLRNPFVFKIAQITTGAGVGCGVGIGVGRPIQLGALSRFGIPVQDLNRLLGKSGRYFNQFKAKLGIKTLDAGIGCGVGIGHGFMLVGVGLKQGVTEQLLQFAQDSGAALASRFGPHLGPLAVVDSKMLLPGSNLISPNPAGPSSPSSPPAARANVLASYIPAASTPPHAPIQMPGSTSSQTQTSEVERLRLEKEILQTLLRQQRQIEDLNEELKALREGKEVTPAPPRPQSTAPRLASSDHWDRCFECRRRARRRS
ncbi:hypothetical protein SELMODRAFT_445541 [Selaginella moellendorffii]|uniref:DNA polymerase epsilon catalytic subunit n=2 Tax=Selaginella moellendorffii TaxID=88036 RepID=D8SJG5_SELML|nr:hypothetical protein SELMODRAFT_445541 [Selaginella moellendorffii]